MSTHPEQRRERIAAFRAELGELERAGALVLTPEQRGPLDAFLEKTLAGLPPPGSTALAETTWGFRWCMRLATFLGGAAFFAAAVLFLHRVWGWLPAGAQVVVVSAFPLALLAGAELLHRRKVDPFQTALLCLASGLAFVLGLNALGSTFNMTPSPHALLAWGGFALLLAYAYGIRLLLAAGLVLVCLYSAALALSVQGDYWMDWLERPGFLVPAPLVLYALPSLGLVREPFAMVYRLCGAAGTLGALLALSLNGDLGGAGLAPSTLELLYQLLGAALGLAVVLHGLRLGASGLINVGSLGFVVFLYVRLHAWWWDWMPKYLFFLLLGLLAVGLLLVFRALRARVGRRAFS